jgi:hypothetical protein
MTCGSSYVFKQLHLKRKTQGDVSRVKNLLQQRDRQGRVESVRLCSAIERSATFCILKYASMEHSTSRNAVSCSVIQHIPRSLCSLPRI